VSTNVVMSDAASPILVALGRDECLRLLSTAAVGRVVVLTPSGTPVIRPVNHTFDQASQSVVFRSIEGTKFATLVRSSKAWFEIDEIDPEDRTAWSVIIAGVTEVVTQPAEVRRLEALGSESWIAGREAQWIRIRARVVSGRRLTVGVTEQEG
jgi:nitroimidazol reductase NimA-like FMN-containing flavoprotein (pyridoxamine 5'-phosphate oxidase superfamily)